MSTEQQAGTRRGVIAVLTYKRPEDLLEILPHLVEQAGTLDAATTSVAVQVVDNDPAGTAREAVESFMAEHPAVGGSSYAGIRYANETTPGIGAARNRALDESVDDDWLVFIDDDERPADGWLAALVDTAERFDAQAVSGPCESILPEDVDPWIVEGGFFDRRHRWSVRTGDRIDEAATNNLWLDMHFVRRTGIAFGRHLGLTGGSDSLFTRAVIRAGGKMVWCAEASVSEPVTAERATRSWVLKRGLRYGNSYALVRLSENDTVPLRLRIGAQGLARIGGGLMRAARASLPVGEGVDVHAQAQGLRTSMRGIGMVLGSTGYAWSEYARDGRHFVKAPLGEA